MSHTVDFILEFLTEEIPARFQEAAVQQLKEKLVEGLEPLFSSLEGGLDSTPKPMTRERVARAVVTYVTPRRLTAHVVGLPTREPSSTTVIKGPRVDAPEAALMGFLRTQGVTLDQCHKEETLKGAFWLVTKCHEGRPISEVLSDLTQSILTTFAWPKSMRWGDKPGSWVRPLRNILAIVVPGEGASGSPKVVDVKWNGLKADNRTQGHPILYPDYVEVRGWQDYLTKMEQRKVMLDRAAKLESIKEGVRQAALQSGASYLEGAKVPVPLAPSAMLPSVQPEIAAPEKLYHEVAGLVEYPWFLVGKIHEKYQSLPLEVLETTLRVHQRYFLVEDVVSDNERHRRNFVVVTNMPTNAPERLARMRKGYESVLDARLEDAAFYWRQDRQKPLTAYIPKLKDRLLHKDLGTLWDKSQRLSVLLGEQPLATVTDVPIKQALAAASLCKADLCTGMVGEFPELQGIMGGYYAAQEGEPQAVCQAISQHYLPQGPDTLCPSTPLGRALSFADKLDTLVAFFAVGLGPTGSKDPYALRRSALGILRLCEEGRYSFMLEPLIRKIVDLLLQQGIISSTMPRQDGDQPLGAEVAGIISAVLKFLEDRLKVMMRDRGYDHKLVASVVSSAWHHNLAKIFQELPVVASFLASEAGQGTLETYRRVVNILEAGKDMQGGAPQVVLDRDAVTHPAELELLQAIESVSDLGFEVASDLASEVGSQLGLANCQKITDSWQAKLAALATLKAPVDAFFEAVMVQDEDPKKRGNRLWMLRSVQALFETTLNFSALL